MNISFFLDTDQSSSPRTGIGSDQEDSKPIITLGEQKILNNGGKSVGINVHTNKPMVSSLAQSRTVLKCSHPQFHHQFCWWQRKSGHFGSWGGERMGSCQHWWHFSCSAISSTSTYSSSLIEAFWVYSIVPTCHISVGNEKRTWRVYYKVGPNSSSSIWMVNRLNHNLLHHINI